MVWLSTWSLTQKETLCRRFPHLAITCSENMFFLKLAGLHRRDELPTSFDQQASGSAVIRSYHLEASPRSPQLQVVQLDEARMRYSLAKVEADKLLFEEHAVRRAVGEAEAALVPIEQQARASAHRVSADGPAYGANYAECHRRCGGVDGCRALHIGAPQRFLQCGAHVRADLAGRIEWLRAVCLGANALRSLNKSELSVLRSLKHPPESAKCAQAEADSAQLSFRQ